MAAKGTKSAKEKRARNLLLCASCAFCGDAFSLNHGRDARATRKAVGYGNAGGTARHVANGSGIVGGGDGEWGARGGRRRRCGGEECAGVGSAGGAGTQCVHRE